MKQHRVPSEPSGEDLARVSQLFKALSDPTRLRLVLRLREGERSVGQLVAALGQPQSTVSRHLALLKGAALVAARRDTTSVYYRLADGHVAALVEEAFSHAQHERLGLPGHPVVDTVMGSMR